MKKMLPLLICFFMLPTFAHAGKYLIAVNAEYFENPNLAGNYNGPPLPVVNELKLASNAEVDVVGLELGNSSSLSRHMRAKKYDLILFLGPEACEMGRQTANSDHAQKFAFIDCRRTTTLPDNVMGYRFNGSFGAFMAGYIAAKMSDKGQIGIIAGKKTTNVLNLVKAYKEGAKLANPKIKIQTEYMNDFFDPRRALTLANRYFASQTDIIFHAAEYSGAGVLQASQRAGKWTMGVNTDLYAELEGAQNILTSVVIDYNMAIMEACNAVESNRFSGGQSVLLTLSNNGVGLGAAANVPPEIMREVETIKAGLLDGSIKLRDHNNKLLK